MHARNKAAISAATGNSEPLCLLCNKTHKAALFKDTSRTQWVPQPINPLLPHRPPHAASLSHWHQLLKVIRKHAVRNHFPPESFSHRFSEHILKRKKSHLGSACSLSWHLFALSVSCCVAQWTQTFVFPWTCSPLRCLFDWAGWSIRRRKTKKKCLNKVWTFPRDHRRSFFGSARWLTVPGRCARGAWPKWRWRDTRS